MREKNEIRIQQFDNQAHQQTIEGVNSSWGLYGEIGELLENHGGVLSTRELMRSGPQVLKISREDLQTQLNNLSELDDEGRGQLEAYFGYQIIKVKKSWSIKRSDTAGIAAGSRKPVLSNDRNPPGRIVRLLEEDTGAIRSEELSQNEQQLLKLIPADGSSKGNYTLIKEFQSSLKKEKRQDVSEQEYWEARNKLIELGYINKARGKGGSVYRVTETGSDNFQNEAIDVSTDYNGPDGDAHERNLERHLYEPFRAYLEKHWVKQEDAKMQFVIHQTADGGSRRTGRWTRPDFAIFSCRTFQFVHGKFCELITFEIKPKQYCNINAVFETAAHARFANRSFLAVHLPTDQKVDPAEFERIEDECIRLGLGLITFKDPNNPETYQIVVEARHHNPDPTQMNEFIQKQMRDHHEKISGMVR